MKERISDVPLNKQEQSGAVAVKEYIPDLTDDELRKLAREKLSEIVQTANINTGLVGVIRELLDRIDGKAPQSIAMTVKQSPESTLSTDQLNALLALLPDPVVIPPMPKKLNVDVDN